MNTIPTVTKNLLIINVLMFLGTIVAQSYGIDLAQYLGLHFFLAEPKTTTTTSPESGESIWGGPKISMQHN